MAVLGDFKTTVRSLLRERLLDAAQSLTASQGWSSVRMSDIASVVGVSRQTVYNEFGSRPALAEALVLRVLENFLAGVTDEIESHRDDFGEAIGAAVEFVMNLAADDPLVKAVVTASRGGAEELLPFLTNRSEPILISASAAVREVIEENWPDLPLDDQQRGIAVEAIVRLVVSHVVQPMASAEDTGRQVAWLARRLVYGQGR